jgi:hypothetical protein
MTRINLSYRVWSSDHGWRWEAQRNVDGIRDFRDSNRDRSNGSDRRHSVLAML